jgi:hypothetical protein
VIGGGDYGETQYLLFPHLLFLKMVNNVFDKPGCCLFVGATDSEVKKIVRIGMLEVCDFCVCLSQKYHFIFPANVSLNQLIKKFWNTRTSVFYVDCWKKCKTPEEVLQVFQYGQLESKNYILQHPVTLEEFIAYAKQDPSDSD